jgi:hypothetical protein
MIKHLNQSQQDGIGSTHQADEVTAPLKALTLKCGEALIAHYAEIRHRIRAESMKNMLGAVRISPLFDDISELVLRYATQYFEGAAKHGYTTDDLTALKNYIEEYRSIVKNNRQRVRGRTEVVQGLRFIANNNRKAA